MCRRNNFIGVGFVSPRNGAMILAISRSNLFATADVRIFLLHSNHRGGIEMSAILVSTTTSGTSSSTMLFDLLSDKSFPVVSTRFVVVLFEDGTSKESKIEEDIACGGCDVAFTLDDTGTSKESNIEDTIVEEEFDCVGLDGGGSNESNIEEVTFGLGTFMFVLFDEDGASKESNMELCLLSDGLL
mmetsp:Transcript_15544/g.23375  ORF Transcript_15544/g.23375 Transcript_15544/m.23375 type:complete len:186 (-) Transcript_15544:625-1182(-)